MMNRPLQVSATDSPGCGPVPYRGPGLDLERLDDALLAQMARALDEAHMAQRLDQVLLGTPGRTHRVRTCRVERVKYKPGRNCLICYRLEIEDLRSAHRGHRLVLGRVYGRGASGSRFAKARCQPHSPVGPLPGVAHLEDLDMVLWCFPNERKLRHLPRLLDGALIETELAPRWVRARWGTGWGLVSSTTELVHYVPEHTASLRVTLTLERVRDGRRMPWVVFGKTYYDDQGQSTWRAMRRLWALRGRTGLLTARPLGHQPLLRTLWQEGLPGEPLADSRRLAADPSLLRQSAQAVSSLHRCRIDGLEALDIPGLMARLEARSRVVGGAYPGLRGPLRELVGQLLRQAPRAHSAVTLHGDLHPCNLLVSPLGVALIDLDSLHRGPAGVDIGSWVACCLYHDCLRARPLDQALHDAMAFAGAYRAAAGEGPGRRELAWFTATALVSERVFRCLTRLKPGRLAVAQQLLRWAHEILREAQGEGELDGTAA